MSDSSKHQQRTGATPIKNPLLSASVTGLTFDDFPNKPLLLPAAPPIVHVPSPPPPVTPTTLLGREHKSLVTVGSSSLDTENLDEINLNASAEDNTTTATIDTNANPLLEQTNTNDSILSQAASSFSALPSVASNVFSSFSKRITAISSRETTPSDPDPNGNFVPQPDIQPIYTQQQQYQQPSPTPPSSLVPQTATSLPFYAPPPAAALGGDFYSGSSAVPEASSLPPTEPPKFYSPAEVPSLPPSTAPAVPPPSAGGPNNFRFTAKKKLYAPIPGLSDQQQQHSAALFQPPTLSDPAAYDNNAAAYPPNDPFSQQSSYFNEERKSEERKAAGGGLFSKITNLAPTGVLQNITGLVQSAAGSITQTIKPETQPSGYEQQPTTGGNFGIVFDQGVPPPPPPAANYFAPNTLVEQQQANYPPPPPATGEIFQSNPSAAGFFQPQEGTFAQPPFLPPTAVDSRAQVNFFNPSAAPAIFDPFQQNSQTTDASRPPRPSSRPANSFSETVPLAIPPSVVSSRPPSQPAVSTSIVGQNTPATSQTPVTFFNPLEATSAPVINPTPPPQVGFFDPTKYLPNLPTAPGQQLPPEATATPPTQIGFFDPSKYLPNTNQEPQAGPSLPPTGATVSGVPLPGGQVSSSYRLQKGTKLYKNPLTAQETAPVQVTPNSVFGVTPTQFPPTNFGGSPNVFHQTPAGPPPAVYNPFGQGAAPSLTPVANIFVPSAEPQSVALFAPPATEVEEHRHQEVPLFAAPTQENTNTLLKAAPEVKENLSEREQVKLEPTPSAIPEVEDKQEPQIQTTEAVNPQYFFKPIEPAAEQAPAAELLQQTTNFFGSSQETQQFLQPIEPLQEPPIKQDATKTNEKETLITAIQDLTIATPTEPATAQPNLPPPKVPKGVVGDNPYRRGSAAEANKTAAVQPSLANFFTPTAATGTGDFSFFSSLPSAPDFSDLQGQSSNEAASNFLTTQRTEQQPQNQNLNFFNPSTTAEDTKPLEDISKQNLSTTSENIFNPKETEAKPQLSNFPKEDHSNQTPYPIDNKPQDLANPAFPQLPTSVGIIPAVTESPEEIHKHSEEAASTQQATPSIGFEGFLPQAGHSQSTPTNFFGTLSGENSGTELTTQLPSSIPTPLPSGNHSTDLFSQLSSPHINQSPSEEPPTSELSAHVPPPLGFENFMPTSAATKELLPNTTSQPESSAQDSQQQQQPQAPIVNNFSNYFNQTVSQETVKDTSSFFDNFSNQQSPARSVKNPPISSAAQASNEDQRIQNFFNNPPPKDADHVGDLNYDLVHSGLAIRNLQQRSLTPVSNLVEPPSSACSEFSTLNASEASVVKQEDTSRLEESSAVAEQSPLIKHYEELPEEVLKDLRMANMLQGEKTSPVASTSYKPAVKHWFYKRTVDAKQVWVPFSHYDSALLETSLIMEGDKPEIVAVEGGRYDVNISERLKRSVYWDSEPIEVRRCSWFYKAVDSKYIPYEESTADVLEAEYKQAAESGVWHKTIILGMGEQVVFHGPTVIVHFQQQQNQDAWGGTTVSQTTTRPRVVKRDLEDFNIAQGESQKVDHLLFMVHGIGSACDLKMRSVEEVVEDFRSIAHQLVQSHYKNSADLGLVGRVEVLPISWHSHLHSIELGIDEKLRSITLESIPKLRNFTNDTLLDILFYTSPTFAQRIMNTIVVSLNEIYMKYRQRHPDFNGGVSLAGHSLGSLILFDLLCHQYPIKESEEKNLENPDQEFLPTEAAGTANAASSSTTRDSNKSESTPISYTMGPAGTGQPFINYGQLKFQPKKFFALGSPIGMFVTIRGIDKLGLDFRLPTCPGFYNIFHPYDPVAYRIEALVNPDLSSARPVLIPHHKGRKRMHLELKETMARVSTDIKQRFLDKFKLTFDTVNFFGQMTKSKKETEELMEKEVEKVIEMQMQMERQGNQQTQSPDQQATVSPNEEQKHQLTPPTSANQSIRTRTDSVSTAVSDDMMEVDFPLGKLNDSKRIDFVLQEAPLEFINEYIFALSSHVCYWDSEDTILFVMKEIYSGLGISPDSQVPQQTMTIERPSSRNSSLSIS
uniref:DDHD domain-containing protein n=1 Tax=Stomoxys calcitrans TaxID=35570 RepID=A0A1I8PDN0_STOCA